MTSSYLPMDNIGTYQLKGSYINPYGPIDNEKPQTVYKWVVASLPWEIYQYINMDIKNNSNNIKIIKESLESWWNFHEKFGNFRVNSNIVVHECKIIASKAFDGRKNLINVILPYLSIHVTDGHIVTDNEIIFKGKLKVSKKENTKLVSVNITGLMYFGLTTTP